jgi:hypothetical protein
MSSHVLPIFAALAVVTHAQETGVWELVPAKGIAPSGLFGHGATTPGYFWTAFNDTAGDSGGFIDVAQYNIIQNTWQNSKDYISAWPQSGYPPQPFGFSFGGFMCLIDELIPSTLYYVSSSPTTSSPTSPNAWQTVPISLTVRPMMVTLQSHFLSFNGIFFFTHPLPNLTPSPAEPCYVSLGPTLPVLGLHRVHVRWYPDATRDPAGMV